MHYNRKEEGDQIKKRAIFLSIFLIVILGFGVYANSLNGKFVCDDAYLIVDNPYIKNWVNFDKIFTKPLGEVAGVKYVNYRPFVAVTYMINYSLSGLNEWGYHLANTLLHIFVVLAIYWLINILFKNNLLSFLTSALFIVHPVNVETVAYVSNRPDCLVALFILLCLIFYIKFLESHSKTAYILMLLSCIFAILSKENSVIIPALLLLYNYAFKRKPKLSAILPIMTIPFAYMLSRLIFFKAAAIGIPRPSTILERIPGFFVAITNYIKLLILPFNLHFDYGLPAFKFSDPIVILGFILMLFLLFYAVIVRKSNKLITFSILWFFLSLLPVSNLYPIFSFMAEHFLYLPAIGFFLILANTLLYFHKIKKFKVPALILAFALLIFYSYLTIKQNIYWSKPEVFYKRILKYNPRSIVALSGLASVYNVAGRTEEAIELLQKAIAINPRHARSYNTLAFIYYQLGNKEKAVEFFKKVIELKPELPDPYYDIGFIYDTEGRHKEAIPYYQRAIELSPGSFQAHFDLGVAYYSLGQIEDAITCFQKALNLKPDLAEAYYNLGLAYRVLKKYGESRDNFLKAKKIYETVQDHQKVKITEESLASVEKMLGE